MVLLKKISFITIAWIIGIGFFALLGLVDVYFGSIF